MLDVLQALEWSRSSTCSGVEGMWGCLYLRQPHLPERGGNVLHRGKTQRVQEYLKYCTLATDPL